MHWIMKQNPTEITKFKPKRNFKSQSWVQKTGVGCLKLCTLYIFNLIPSLETPESINSPAVMWIAGRLPVEETVWERGAIKREQTSWRDQETGRSYWECDSIRLPDKHYIACITKIAINVNLYALYFLISKSNIGICSPKW